ncbi:MAG: serine/threonine-protein kinase [Acidobacteriota bacterium]|jgi:serine/threonine-protein kinase
MSLPEDRWRRADAILDRALELSGEDRDRYVAQACGEDDELRGLVERLLDDANTADSRLKAGGGLGFAERLEGADAAGSLAEGTVIDRYRIRREIGRGGMAVVYLAERADEEFRHEVALKLIQRGRDTDEIVRRFSQERQIMALASHPNIARLLDGGATADGRPYFVMEYVEGLPIDRYCDDRKLSIADRVRLFLRVAAAVAYAHRNLVVHRDIKPSNILVGADGEVKLLDFGIARYLGEEDDAGLTRTGTRLMTPAYASPEQVTGGAVTTASDVYQLGLLLYEMLTGRFPYDVKDRDPDTLQRAIREEAPTRPSTAVRRTGSDPSGETTTPEAISAERGTSPAQLRRELSGDLDNIILMALRKEPERRYGSVGQLAEDLERYLQGHPVSARPDTLAYRASKFARRHRVPVALAGGALLLLIGFAVTMTVQAGRIARERDRANREAETSRAVSDFLVELFRVSDPGEARGNSVTAREILDEGAGKISEELSDQPAVQAALMETMGRVYQNLGLYDAAMPLLRRSVDVRRAATPDDDLGLAGSTGALAWLLEKDGKFDEAESLMRESLERTRAALGERDPKVAGAMNNLALFLYESGNLEAAEPLHREALALRRELLGDEHEDVADSLSNLALVVHAREQYDEAEQLYTEALEIRRKVLGPDHPKVAISLDNLGRLYFDRKDLDTAERYFQDALEIRTRVLGDEHPDTSESLNNLASLLFRKGDLAGAVPLFERAVAVDRKMLGADHPDYAVSLGNLAIVMQRSGDPGGALPRFREALAILDGSVDEGHWLRAMGQGNLGGCLLELQRYDEAEPLLLASYEGLRVSMGPDHRRTRGSLERLVELYEATGREDRAATYRALLPDDAS